MNIDIASKVVLFGLYLLIYLCYIALLVFNECDNWRFSTIFFAGLHSHEIVPFSRASKFYNVDNCVNKRRSRIFKQCGHLLHFKQSTKWLTIYENTQAIVILLFFKEQMIVAIRWYWRVFIYLWLLHSIFEWILLYVLCLIDDVTCKLLGFVRKPRNTTEKVF